MENNFHTDTDVYTIHVNIDVPITKQDIEDIVITALNGGIDYWACLDNSQPEFHDMGEDDCVDAWTAKILLDYGHVIFIDEEDGETKYYLTLSTLINGIKMFVEKGYDEYRAISSEGIDCCNIDANAADSIIQLAIFGELVFG